MQNEYISSEIAERIKLIAKSKGLTVSTVLKEVNLGRNTMANFKTSMPKADNLAKSLITLIAPLIILWVEQMIQIYIKNKLK